MTRIVHFDFASGYHEMTGVALELFAGQSISSTEFFSVQTANGINIPTIPDSVTLTADDTITWEELQKWRNGVAIRIQED